MKCLIRNENEDGIVENDEYCPYHVSGTMNIAQNRNKCLISFVNEICFLENDDGISPDFGPCGVEGPSWIPFILLPYAQIDWLINGLTLSTSGLCRDAHVMDI